MKSNCFLPRILSNSAQLLLVAMSCSMMLQSQFAEATCIGDTVPTHAPTNVPTPSPTNAPTINPNTIKYCGHEGQPLLSSQWEEYDIEVPDSCTISDVNVIIDIDDDSTSMRFMIAKDEDTLVYLQKFCDAT